MAIFLPTAQKETFPGKSGSVPRREDAPSRIVLHTTETNRLPGYRGGKAAPHFTIGVGHPGSLPGEQMGVVRVWQHISLDRTAYALRHPRRTPETNHMGAHCIQIECVTYIGDQPDRGIVGNKGNLPPPLTDALAGLVREIAAALGGINIDEYPETWSSSGSYGVGARQRMTNRQWEAFNGICGHQHVPNNTHWDPGALDIRSFVRLVGSDSAGSGATSVVSDGPSEEGWPLLFEEGDRDEQVVIIRGILQALGYGEFSPSELYNATVAAGVKRLQTDEGITVDGIWGPQTHSYARARLNAKLDR